MDSVGKWLQTLGLGDYTGLFAEHAIGWDVLADLDDSDLDKIGVRLGDRKRLLKAIAALDSESSPSRPSADSITPVPSQSADAERRQLTVMFCDLVGSTALAERLDPEDLRHVIAGCQDVWKKTIGRFDGFLARYMGDGVLVYFGYPRAHEDAAEQGVSAGLGIIDAMAALDDLAARNYGIDLAVRIGIATGSVVVGDLGEGSAKESAVFGETPNLAARLQAMAEPDAVLVSPSTRRLTAGQFNYRDLGEQKLKGVSEPVRAWQVMGEGDAKSRFEALYSQRVTPLVGRDEEAALLNRCWQRAKEGEGQVVLISGEPGIGKSRLCETLVDRIAVEPHHTLRYQCSARHSSSALYPVIRQLEQAAAIDPHSSEEDKFDSLERLVCESNAVPERDLPLLAALLSLPLAGRYQPIDIEPKDQKERTLDALVHHLECLSDQRPLLALFEDLHWVDPSTIELLDRLVEKVEKLPVLLLATFRPEYQSPWTNLGHVTPVALNRISKRECRVMLAEVAGAGSLPEAVTEEILAKTDGVPLFIEELTRTVVDANTKAGPRARDGQRLEVPATLQDSLMARLDRLSLGKQVAQTGAAIGRDFTETLLRPVCDIDESQLKQALDELVSGGIVLIRHDGPVLSYSFKHALLQDAAYNSLLFADRRILHRRIAEVLGGHFTDQPAALAHHYEYAGELHKAFDYRLKAAGRAAGQYATWEAIAQYWHALELLEQLPETRDKSRQHVETMCRLCRVTGGYFWRDESEHARAARHLDIARESAELTADLRSAARLQAFKGENWDDEELLARAVCTAGNSGDKRVQAEVASRNAGHFGRIGRYEDSHEHVRRAIEMYAELGEEVKQGLSMASHGRCYHARAGKLKESLDFSRQVRGIAERTGDPGLKAWLAMESEPYMYKGLWDRTVEIVEQGLPAAWEIGNWNVVLFSSAWATIACIKLGRLEAARMFIDSALRGAGHRATSEHPQMYPQIALSSLELASGNPQEAMIAGRKALALAEHSRHGLEKGAAYRALGRVYETLGDDREADVQYRRSLDVLDAIQCGPELAQSLLAYGRFKITDQADEGWQLLDRSLRLFEEMDATGWIGETKAMLEMN